MAINVVKKVYAFGCINDDPFPRPLVGEATTDIRWRPATLEEFVEHHATMVTNLLVEAVTIGKIGLTEEELNGN